MFQANEEKAEILNPIKVQKQILNLQASLAANNAQTQSYTSLLKAVEADARLVEVDSVCSMDAHFYSEHRTRPGICNIQLKVQIHRASCMLSTLDYLQVLYTRAAVSSRRI